MRHKKMRNVVSFLLLACVLFSGMMCLPAEAGLSNIIIDKGTYTEELDGSIWNNPDGDIVIEKDVMVFGKDSTETTRVITKEIVAGIEEVDELVRVQSTFCFTELPEEEKFAMAFGVQRIEAMQGETGNVEITFQNKDGVVASLVYYDEAGEAVTLGESTKCGALNTKIAVEAVITTQKVLTVNIGGKICWSAQLPVSGEGRIGFLQTGSCGVRLSDVKIVSHAYDSPENCDINETFEANGFNANLLTSKMQGASYVCWPSGTGIEEYNGESVFRYTNAGECYVGTKYAYSNFELSFDVPYLQRQNVMDENGKLTTASSNRFGISYGGEAVDFDYAGYESAVADVVWFNKNSTIVSDRTGQSADAKEAGYPFFSVDCDKGFSVKISMYDSVVTVSVKWMEEDTYKEVLKYQLSTITPTGYLHIWTNGPTNMAIDNLKIVNTDLNPTLTDVDFKTSIIEGPGHYEYEPVEKTYAEETEETGFNWYLVLAVVAVICVVAFAAMAGIAVLQKRKQIISIILIVVVVSGTLFGCEFLKNEDEIEPMKVENSNAISFDIIGGKDVMPIGGYYIPYSSTYSYNGNDLPNYISDEFYAMIEESGINFLAHSMTEYSTAPELVMQNLDLGEKYGIAVFVDDSTIMNQAGREEVSKEDISIQLTNYMNHPAFAGLYITDEPTAEYTYNYKPDHTLDKYGTISRLLNDEIGVVGYVNAFHSGGTEKEKAVYEKYIEDFYNTLHPQYLSFDRYIFDAQHRDKMRNFFYELDVLRKVSQKYEIPFWSFIGAGSQWNDDFTRFDSTTPYYPTEGEFKWSANVALSFGTQGLQYFPLIQPHYYAWAESTEFDFERNGIFGAWGNKTQWYSYAQNLNKQVAAIDEVLMNAVNKGVIASGKKANEDTAWVENAMIDGRSWRELDSVQGDALIGCFNYQGKTALYVTNYSYENAQKIDLKWNGKYRFTVIQDGETKHYEGKGITLDMFAGDGALVVFE